MKKREKRKEKKGIKLSEWAKFDDFYPPGLCNPIAFTL